MRKRIKVLVVDEYSLVREGVVAIINSHKEMMVVGAAESAEAALEVVEATAVDVVMMAISLKGRMNGIEAARKIRELSRDTRVIIASIYCNKEFIDRALEAGASGYFCKKCESSEMLTGIRRVAEGHKYFCRRAAAAMAQGSGSLMAELTGKEKQALCHVKRGLSAKESAGLFGVSVHTVNGHRGKLLKKLGVDSIHELLASMLGEEHRLFLSEN